MMLKTGYVTIALRLVTVTRSLFFRGEDRGAGRGQRVIPNEYNTIFLREGSFEEHLLVWETSLSGKP
jgi:hypothetical protein